MRVHYLQHVSFEGLGRLEDLLLARGCALSRSPLYEAPSLPDAADFDALIAMGGPMSVNDEAEFPWLAAEKRLVRDAVRGGKPVLGVCLGAQLIASALGARVYRNAETEIGWFPIEGVGAADSTRFAFPPSAAVFHWHGETFDLPAGAVRLAGSAACANQAFQIGRRTIGLQFHLETTRDSARLLVDNCGAELVPGRFIQNAEAILSADESTYAAAGALLERLVDYLFG
jgi:GMP synthase-like glutamine amidotransferase